MADGGQRLRIDRTDRIGLLPGIVLGRAAVVDEHTDRSFPLAGLGHAVVNALDGTRPIGAVSDALADRYGADRHVVWLDVLAFLYQLDAQVLLRVEHADRLRRWRERAVLYLVLPAVALADARDLVLGRSHPVSHRFRATPGGVARGCLAAQGPLLAALVLVSEIGALATYLGTSLASETQRRGLWALVLTPLLMVAVHLALMVGHELGHLGALRACGVRCRYVLRRGFLVGIAHDRARRGHERFVSLAGPLAAVALGALASALLAIGTWRQDHVPQVMTWFPLIVGCLHLVSLGPWSSDGRILLRPSATTEAAG